MKPASECPVMDGREGRTTAGAMANRDGWPNQQYLQLLHQNSNPGEAYVLSPICARPTLFEHVPVQGRISS